METMEKISVSDLSIGDWVRYIRKRKKNDDYFQVAHIFRGEKEWLVGRKNDDIFGSHSLRLKDIEPIPLTPELLEKNGFIHDKWSNKIWRYENEESEVVYYFESSRLLIINADSINLQCEHIHQLQHALRLAKCGKEIVL